MLTRTLFSISPRVLALCATLTLAGTVAVGLSSPTVASALSCTGTFTEAEATSCTVDPYLTALHIVAVGGRGGSNTAAGGFGANVSADLAVSEGSVLFVHVAGNGHSNGTGGANGGGAGGSGTAAGGGGASDVRTSSDSISSRVLVAGGGGGGGAGSVEAWIGGNADGGSGGFILGGTGAVGSTAGKGEASVWELCEGQDGGGTGSGVGGAGHGLAGGGGGGYAGGGGGGEIETIEGTCKESEAGGGGGGSSLVPGGGVLSTDATGTPSITITAPVPTTSTKPGISGSLVEGQLLTESHAEWSHGPTGYTYEWLRCEPGGGSCVPVASGTSTYRLVVGDVGHTIEVRETASNSYGNSRATGASGIATSAPTSTILPLPPSNSGLPMISGTTVQGQTLSTNNGSWTGAPTSFAYQWQDCDTGGNNCANVGTNTSSYTLTANDVGHSVRVTVTAANAGGSASATSALSATVTTPPPPPPPALPRVASTMTWSFGWNHRFTLVESLVVHSVPKGGYVEVLCAGRGCPFAHHRSATVSRRRRRVRQGPTVSLSALFKRRHLGVGTRISVRVLKAGSIGKSYVFTVRSHGAPSVAIGCLAPGSSVPNKGC